MRTINRRQQASEVSEDPKLLTWWDAGTKECREKNEEKKEKPQPAIGSSNSTNVVPSRATPSLLLSSHVAGCFRRLCLVDSPVSKHSDRDRVKSGTWLHGITSSAPSQPSSQNVTAQCSQHQSHVCTSTSGKMIIMAFSSPEVSGWHPNAVGRVEVGSMPPHAQPRENTRRDQDRNVVGPRAQLAEAPTGQLAHHVCQGN